MADQTVGLTDIERKLICAALDSAAFERRDMVDVWRAELKDDAVAQMETEAAALLGLPRRLAELGEVER